MARLTRRSAILLGLASFLPFEDVRAEEPTKSDNASSFSFPDPVSLLRLYATFQVARLGSSLGPGVAEAVSSGFDESRVKNFKVDLLQCGPSFIVLVPGAGEIELLANPLAAWKFAPCVANVVSDALPLSMMNVVHDSVSPFLTPWGLVGAGAGWAMWGSGGATLGADLSNLAFDLGSLDYQPIRSGEAFFKLGESLVDVYADRDASATQGSLLLRGEGFFQLPSSRFNDDPSTRSQKELGPGTGDLPVSRTKEGPSVPRPQVGDDDPTQ